MCRHILFVLEIGLNFFFSYEREKLISFFHLLHLFIIYLFIFHFSFFIPFGRSGFGINHHRLDRRMKDDKHKGREREREHARNHINHRSVCVLIKLHPIYLPEPRLWIDSSFFLFKIKLKPIIYIKALAVKGNHNITNICNSRKRPPPTIGSIVV